MQLHLFGSVLDARFCFSPSLDAGTEVGDREVVLLERIASAVENHLTLKDFDLSCVFLSFGTKHDRVTSFF